MHEKKHEEISKNTDTGTAHVPEHPHEHETQSTDVVQPLDDGGIGGGAPPPTPPHKPKGFE